ncbi:MAG: RtcB family protein [Spirochaetaceae bacterium]|jgi:tRNA-splicing ligase RtcB|nr:RtcB family protein [Spirochaetaceae bacterium]
MVQWELTDKTKLPIRSWCRDIEADALEQARNLANHPVTRDHVALMPDAHTGYGMPIGGVIACEAAVIPNAVGVDIGCGMGAIKTNLDVDTIGDMAMRRSLIEEIKVRIPVGEGHSRKEPVAWEGFSLWHDSLDGSAEEPAWYTDNACQKLDRCNLGTLGGGNHFIELQKSEDGTVWLMLHSGSRNLGYRIAYFYHRQALLLNEQMGVELSDKNLAYLPVEHELGKAYIRDMNHALSYAQENRRIMMHYLKELMSAHFSSIEFLDEINIHHNYAAPEYHSGSLYWIHRKGATSARAGELGIIPGSMGTASYIVCGLGNEASFSSCSHGAGRRMGRADACRRLIPKECDEAMSGIVFDRWKRSYIKDQGKRLPDLSEAPAAYKNIDKVIEAELDLVRPVVKLQPLAVVKG